MKIQVSRDVTLCSRRVVLVVLGVSKDRSTFVYMVKQSKKKN
jgi:hypothetical protein